MWTPRFLWIPEHLMQMKIPRLTLAHLGPDGRQNDDDEEGEEEEEEKMSIDRFFFFFVFHRVGAREGGREGRTSGTAVGAVVVAGHGEKFLELGAELFLLLCGVVRLFVAHAGAVLRCGA